MRSQTPPWWANIHAACPCSAGCFGTGTGHRRDYLIVAPVCHMRLCYLGVQMASFVAFPLQTASPDDSLSGSEQRIHWANIRRRRLYLPTRRVHTAASAPPRTFTGSNVANWNGQASHRLTSAFSGTRKQQQLIGPINAGVYVGLLEHN